MNYLILCEFEEILKIETVKVVTTKGIHKRTKKHQLEDKQNNENNKKKVLVVNILNLAEVQIKYCEINQNKISK